MKLMIPKAAAMSYLATIKRQRADAVQALRVAAAKLGEAAEAYDYNHDCLDEDCLLEAQYSARAFADLLDDGGKPTIAPQVFRGLANYVNRNAREAPHVQGAVIALALAERCLNTLLDITDQLDGLPIDKPFQVPFAARGTIRGYLVAITSAVYVFDHDEALDAVLSGKRTQTQTRQFALAA